MKNTITTAAMTAMVLWAGAASAGFASPVCGDVNASSSITTTDALLVLKKSVDQPIFLNCSAYDSQYSACVTSLTGVNANLSTCNTSLSTCDAYLSATNAYLSACQASLAGVCIPDPDAAPRFVDNADGTVTDKKTCLMWEKKNGADGLQDFENVHDVDNGYQWSSTGSAPDGNAFTDFLVRINAPTGVGSPSSSGPTVTGCFAQHCDWRLPTIEELQNLSWPAVPEFQPDQASLYWSASTYSGDTTNVWYFDTGGAGADHDIKLGSVWLRAVRRSS